MVLFRKDIAAGIAFIILAVAYWLGADNIPKSLLEGGVGAEALPKMLGVLLFILAAILVLQSVLAGRKKAATGAEADADAEESGDDESEAPREKGFMRHKRAVGLLLIGVGYVLLVETIGYVPAIAYLLGAILWFAGGASRRAILLFSVLGAVFFWLLFVETLGIRQPQGFWPKLWHQISSHAETSPAVNSTSTALL